MPATQPKPYAFIQNPLLSVPSTYIARAALQETDLIITVSAQQVYLVEATPLLPVNQISNLISHSENVQFLTLGTFGPHRVLIHHHINKIPESAEAQWGNLRKLAVEIPAELASIAAQACAITHWHEHNQYCANCGGTTTLSKEHARVCDNSACNTTRFPRIDPAMIVAVVNDQDEILLSHEASWRDGMYSVLAGFLSHGESLEDCVRREVKEETGVNLDSVTYLCSQPWPFPGAIMIGFQATAKKQPIIIDQELEDAFWISREALRQKLDKQEMEISNSLSISRHLIDHWLAEESAA